jgi:hypothetical protein
MILAYIQVFENKALKKKARHDEKKGGNIFMPVVFCK